MLNSFFQQKLNRTEKILAVLYYAENMKIKDIAETLDLSEAQAAQMRSSIFYRAKSHLQEQNLL